MHESKNNNMASLQNKVMDSSYVGASQVVLVFGAGHPFDLVKTRMQANPSIISGLSLSKNLLQNSGFRGFYTGGIPNFTRVCAKEMFRNPARGFFKKFYSDNLPTAWQDSYGDLKNIATSASMATTETFFLCPLERIKVWLMTNPNEKSMLSFFKYKQNGVPLYQNLFRGLRVTYTKSMVSWTSYLVAEEQIRKAVMANSPRVNPGDGDLPLFEQLLVGTLSGIVNSIAILPFDTVKTQIQKSGSIEKQKILKTMSKVVEQHGIQGLYKGWQFRLPHYIILAMITSNNIQKVDKIWGIEDKHSTVLQKKM